MLREETPDFIPCACGAHALVVQVGEWDCQADKDVPNTSADITMWDMLPSRQRHGFWKNLFYLPRYTFRLSEAWKALTGERYAEWVVLDPKQVRRLIEALERVSVPSQGADS
jgi:hypothetical protein